MKLTPQQRRNRIMELARKDEEYRHMMEEYGPAKTRFEKFVDKLPLPVRNLLWSYPGMGYLLHGRILTLVCEHMRFPDEDENTPQP